MFIFLFVIFSAIFLPIQLGFSLDVTDDHTKFQLFVDGLFFLDVLVNFNTAYREKSSDLYIYSHKRIAFRYLKFWFWLDSIASIPFDNILSSSHVSAIGASKSLRMFKLAKIFKIGKFSVFTEKLSELHIKPTMIELLRFGVQMIYCAHLFACIWNYIALDGDSSIVPSQRRTWQTEFGFENSEMEDKYVGSLYYVLVTMLTVGFGDIHATNGVERAYSIIAMLLGSLIFGALIAKVGLAQQKSNPHAQLYKDSMNELKLFLEERSFPTDLRSRVKVQCAGISSSLLHCIALSPLGSVRIQLDEDARVEILVDVREAAQVALHRSRGTHICA